MEKHLIPGAVAVLIVGGIYLYTMGYFDGTSREGYEVSAHELMYHGQVVGWYAEPEEEGDFPGIVIAHEWWGLNDHIKERATELSKHGYRVLAVDLFGKVATTPEEARAQVAALDQEAALANLKAAAAFLRQEGSTKIAILGWCFGGGQAMKFALIGEPLDASVIYYGTLETDPEKLKSITWPVLGIFGEEDAAVPIESVREFEAALNSLGIENEIHVYPGVGHAFANPSGDNYASIEAKDAWEKTLSFLERNLK